MKLTDGDAAFLLGKQGKTKRKIALVSGADIELFERDLTLEIKGTEKQIRAARKYAECVMAQRTGPVNLEDTDHDGDRDVVDVPQVAVGFVTGKGGNFLRAIEEEWTVIMFFVEFSSSRGRDTERLAIFGEQRGRKGAMLKVMSAVETKVPGYFKPEQIEEEGDGDFGISTGDFKSSDEVSYALGKMGATRKKLQASSECIVQYVGSTICYAGTRSERRRGKEYMKFLFDQLDGPVDVDPHGRDDCTVVEVPQDTVGYITGARRAALIAMEGEWGVFMFFMGSGGKGERDARGRDKNKQEDLLIFGPERSRKGAELKVLSSVETKNPGYVTRDFKEKISKERGFDVDCFQLRDEDISYALGQKGATRIKLQISSGAVLQYIGNYACLGGDLKTRKRCKEYLQWLLAQRRGQVTVGDVGRRDDVTEMHIPQGAKGFLTGNRGSELRRVEQDTDTYLFMAQDNRGDERLLIFGVDPGDRSSDKGRMRAERILNEMLQDFARNGGRDRRDDRRGRDRRDSRGRGGGRDRRDSRRRDSRRRR